MCIGPGAATPQGCRMASYSAWPWFGRISGLSPPGAASQQSSMRQQGTASGLNPTLNGPPVLSLGLGLRLRWQGCTALGQDVHGVLLLILCSCVHGRHATLVGRVHADTKRDQVVKH